MSNINDFPIDDWLKSLITNIVRNKLSGAGIEMNDNASEWFKDNCAEELIENVLDAIKEWSTQKMN